MNDSLQAYFTKRVDKNLYIIPQLGCREALCSSAKLIDAGVIDHQIKLSDPQLQAAANKLLKIVSHLS